jgi:hypothetical protein
MLIAVCSTSGRCLPVLRASLEAYAPDHRMVLASKDGDYPNDAKNFGDAYNSLLFKIFETESECIVSNDDVVINPYTMPRMLEDVAVLKASGHKVGWVGARSDYVLPAQNIRVCSSGDKFVNLRFASENSIRTAQVIAPIFAWVSREAFLKAPFPPIDWYSDNVSCDDMTGLGYKHFVSRAYVHHVGGDTTGADFNRLIADAAKWMWPNRPAYAQSYDLPKPETVLGAP